MARPRCILCPQKTKHMVFRCHSHVWSPSSSSSGSTTHWDEWWSGCFLIGLSFFWVKVVWQQICQICRLVSSKWRNGMQHDATGQVRMRWQSERRKLRINKWVWHGVAMDPSEMCGSEPPKWLKSYSWIDEIPQHDTPGSALASPKKYSLRRHLSFHNCQPCGEDWFPWSLQASPSISKHQKMRPHSPWHVVVIAPWKLGFHDVSWCFLKAAIPHCWRLPFSEQSTK